MGRLKHYRLFQKRNLLTLLLKHGHTDGNSLMIVTLYNGECIADTTLALFIFKCTLPIRIALMVLIYMWFICMVIYRNLSTAISSSSCVYNEFLKCLCISKGARFVC